MRAIITACLAAFLVQTSPVAARSIRVEHGYLAIVVERGQRPYRIGSVSFRTAAGAARFLDYLDKNWPVNSRPTILVEYRDKLAPQGDEKFATALLRIERGTRWNVIRMPPPRGTIPASWMILEELEEKWSKRGAKARRHDP